MNARSIVATLVALCFSLFAATSFAQTSPSAPTITSVTGNLTSLTVVWSAPTEDGGSTITAYDLRYIRSDAAANATDSDWTVLDDAWTTGPLTHMLSDLRRDTSYDIQLRAVNADGNSDWSDASTQGTTDHGDSTAAATTLALGATIEGSINPSLDADYFRIVVSSGTDLWVYASGPLDTTGYLLNSNGNMLTKNQDSGHITFSDAFSIRREVNSGTYYVKVESRGQLLTGTYAIHATAARNPGHSASTAQRIELNSMTPGRLWYRRGDLAAIDYYKFHLDSATEVWALGVGDLDTVGKLIHPNGWIITSNDDSSWPNMGTAFLLRARLDPGAYYINVKGYGARNAGPYTLELRAGASPGSSQAEAAPVTLDVPQTGHLSSTTDIDHFSFSIESDRYVVIHVLSHGDQLPVTISGTGISSLVDAYSKPHSTWADRGRAKIGYWIWGKLAAGDYNIAVSPAGPDTGRYMIFINTDRYGEVLDTCEAITTSFDDPLYGCQWHLNNTGQFPNGAMQDIGIEDVWDDSDPATMGEGINIAVVDDGIDADHADLSLNVNASRNHNYNTGTTDVSNPQETHGTGVAGIIAARDNSAGVRGVAPRATIYGYNLFGSGVTTSANTGDAMTRNMADTAVSNNSWGYSPLGPGNPAHAEAIWERAVVNGVTNGNVVNGKPKGVSYIFAAGNGHAFGGLSSLSGLTTHYAVTAVCAVNYNDKRSSYSQRGANLWVCGLSNDRGAIHDLPAITTLRNNDRYRDDFSGTSAAVPIVSGVVALIRAANEELTWRDVKVILAESARKNDPGDPGWRMGEERYGSDGKYEFNDEYGFGVVDAKAAVDLATIWTNLPPMRARKAVSTDAAQPIPAASLTASWTYVPGATIESTLTMDDYVEFIEFVQIDVNLQLKWFRNIDVELISPSGKSAMLSTAASIRFASEINGSFRSGSALHLGEDSVGVWKLRLKNRLGTRPGTLRGWSVTVIGHGYTPGLLTVSTAIPGAGSLDVSWTAPAAVDGENLTEVTSYDLRYIRADASDKSEIRWTTVNNLGADGTLQHRLGNLDPLIKYQIMVRAHNDASPGPWSRVFAATTFDNPPSVPRDIAVASRNTALAVSWREPSSSGGSATSYDVRHIASAATDKADPTKWTEHADAWTDGDGDLGYLIPNLTNADQYDVQVRGANDGGPGDWSSTTTETPELSNSHPRFPLSADYTRSVDENIPAGAVIGDPVVAVDDEADPLTYSLSSQSDLFGIDATNGQLLTKKALDYEDRSTYTVTVQVSDLKDLMTGADTVIDDTVTVTVEVINVDEPPKISGPQTPGTNENSEARVASYTASDPDGDPLSDWDREGVDRDQFEISNGELSFIDPPDFEAPADFDGNNDYEVTLVATAGALEGRYDVTIIVQNVNEAPEATDDSATTNEDTPVSIDLPNLVSDPDSDDLTLGVRNRPSRGTAVFVPITYQITYTPNADQHGSDSFTYIVSDGRLNDTGEITLTIDPVNDSPVFRSSSAELEVAIDAQAGDNVGRPFIAIDIDGDTPTYTLSSSSEFAIDERRGQITVKQGAIIDPLVDSYYVTVTADDQQGQFNSTVSVDLTIRVVELEVLTLSSVQPVENVGLTATLTEPDRVTIKRWQWQRSQSRSNWSDISGASSADYTPVNADVGYYLRVTVTYEDPHQIDRTLTATTSGRVVAAPVDNDPPTFSPDETGQRSVDENSRHRTAIGAAVTATDPERDGLVYSIDNTHDNKFEIDRNTGQLRVGTAANLDHETGSTYSVTVSVSDPFNPAVTQRVTINVTDVNEAPVVSGTQYFDFREDRGHWEVGNYSASDPEDDMITWSLSGPDVGDFQIDQSGNLSFRQPPDADRPADQDRDNQYEVNVVASDGSLQGELDVTVSVQDVNEPPVITGATDIDFPENSSNRVTIFHASDPEAAANPLIWSLNGSDADRFELRGSSRGSRDLYFKSAPDFESQEIYNVTIQASDGSMRTDYPVLISINNLDEAETLTLSSDHPVEDVLLTATLTEPDRVTNKRWQWQRSQSRSNWSDISGASPADYTPANADVGYYLRVTVTYDDPHRFDRTLTATTSGRVVAAPVDNDPPTFSPDETGQRSVDENSRPGTAIEGPVEATDPEHDRLVYSIDNTHDNKFEIDRNTGQLRVGSAANLDHETGSTYSVTVSVSDPFNPAVTQRVTINVTDVNEAPVVSGTQYFDFPEDRGHWEVGNYSASDPEDDMITWSLSGPDVGDFQIDQSGNLSFRQPPDADRPADQDRDNQYEVNVVASDGSLQGELDVTVSVQDVNEPPVITGATDIDFPENSSNRVTIFIASDPEAAANPLIWSLNGSDADRFELRGSSRGTRDLYFKSAPDFESQEIYNVTIQASDGSLRTDYPVLISINNLDEAETLTLSSDQPVEDVLLTATLTEPDRVTNKRWQWQRSQSRSNWSDISGASSADYTPANADVGYYLRVTVTYDDPHQIDRTLTATTSGRVVAAPVDNDPPTFSYTEPVLRTVDENSRRGTAIEGPVEATDPEHDRLVYSLDTTHDNKFEIDRNTGQLRVGSAANLDHETGSTYSVTVSVSDPFNPAVTQRVTINVTDVNEAPEATDDSATTNEDTPVSIDLPDLVSDPDSDDLTLSVRNRPSRGTAVLEPITYQITYTPNADQHGSDSFSYIVSDGRLNDTGEITLTIDPVNDPPVFRSSSAELEVAIDAQAGDNVGRPFIAIDIDGDTPTYTLSFSSEFAIDERRGQITVKQGATIDPLVDSYYVTVTADDQQGQVNSTVSVDLTIRVVEQPTPQPAGGSGSGGGGGGGGGGPPPIPIPSDAEFDWNVTRDIESLHPDNDLPTGLWSNGEVLWVVENSSTGADRLFAYDLNTGERLEEHEFELDSRNRFSHGIWSDGELLWIADSGQDKLFAYQLETGERAAARDLELDDRNRDPRGIWSNGELILVLDSVKHALFAYDLDSGRLSAEYPLDKLNNSPRGIWSDGFTIWVSDDGANRIFAYRIESETLNRYEDQEFPFRSLLKAGNGEARGIWSDGDVIFVADEQDDQIYTYNLPDAIDGRLASLTLSGVEFGEFFAAQTEYAAVVDPVLAQTTVEAVAAQSEASIEITPADADNDPSNGHQASLLDGHDITVEVTSADGSRTLAYRVSISHCLSGLSETRLNSVQYAGGSVEALVDCAQSLGVDALYHYRDAVWVAFFPEAPEFLSHAFRNRFAEGVPAGEVLIASRESIQITAPATPSPN